MKLGENVNYTCAYAHYMLSDSRRYSMAFRLFRPRRR